MYEYDPSEPSLGQAFANMLRGFQNPQQWQETGQGIVNTAKTIPSVVESLGRGGVAQAVGTMGDLRDLRNTVQSYLPQSVQNWSNAAEFLTNPYAKALIQTAPTTEQTLEAVPRMTPTYEGAGQHEVLGEFIAPSLGYFGGKALKAGKGLPVGLSIEDVTPPPAKVAEALRQPEKNALGFYSPLDEAVMNLQNQKGTGQQYLAQLLKTQGVKQEEVATRGLDTFLNENPKVSKEQLINYLRENPVELKETVLGEGGKRDLKSVNAEDYRLGEGQPLDDPDYISNRAEDIYHEDYVNDLDLQTEVRDDLISNNPERYTDWETSDTAYERLMRDVDDELKSIAYDRATDEYWDNPYNEYTDELGYKVIGNDDVGYHITDPNGHILHSTRNGVYDIDMAESAIREDALERGFLHHSDDEYGTKYHDYTLPNGENYKEVLLQYEPKRSPPNYEIKELPEEDKTFGKYYGVYQGDKLVNSWHGKTNAEDWVAGQKANYKDYGNYQSGHFDEPNILTHLRTTDRTIDGKKTLFVEEIQSDWHQQGRKKGYKDDPALQNAIAEKQKLVDEQAGLQKELQSYTNNGEKYPPDLFAYYEKVANAIDAEQQKIFKLEKAVPNAPFKKNWQELAMKRAMQMAAEGGYDRVAFTTGKQQNERYNLARYLDEVYYKKNDDGTYTVSAIDKQHRSHMGDSYTPEQIEEHLGKDMAKKIVEDQGKTIERSDSKSISGEGLSIGGEGMKGFYDKILPDFINKYGKKHGLKVSKTNINPDKIRLDLSDDELAEGLKAIGSNTQEFYKLSIPERSKVYERVSKEIYPLGDNPVHYFDLTPEAKESFLKKGQPMFAVAPALAITDEDSRREVLEKLFNSKK